MAQTQVRKFFRPMDFAVIGAVLLLALLLLVVPLMSAGAETAVLEVLVDGQVTRLSLSEDTVRSFCNRGYTLTVTVADGYASVTASDCEEGRCMRMGPISRPGETILCARAEILLRVVGDWEGYDAVAG